MKKYRLVFLHRFKLTWRPVGTGEKDHLWPDIDLVSVHKRGFFSKIEEGDKNNHRHIPDIPRIIF
jgi:hypothetical protein